MFDYLNDRKSWILFFLFALIVVNLLLWIDSGLEMKIPSLLYMDSLLVISFVLFLCWRFWKETKYTRKLKALAVASVNDLYEALPETNFASDEQMNELLRTVGLNFSKEITAIRQTAIDQGEHTAAWVHEIKAPLTAMKLLIDANMDHPASRRIEAEWLRIFLLIDQQLYISRMPTLESDYLPEKTPLSQLVSTEILELRSWCNEKNIAIQLDELEAVVVTDKKWSQFVLRQILMNAIKYSAVGGTIYVSSYSSNKGATVLSISDEGPGIPSHDMPRIFDKGFTGSNGRIQHNATGLGLYLAKSISEKLGIILSAQSDGVNGTTMMMAFSMENEFDKIRK